MKDDLKLTFSKDLKGFFLEKLEEKNRHSHLLFPKEILFYSSALLERFAEPTALFEKNENGQMREKVLGKKYLESYHLSKSNKQKTIKEVAECSLMMSSFFVESANKRILNPEYYIQLGQSAYLELDKLVPDFLDIPQFYANISVSFERVSKLLNLVSLDLSLSIDFLSD